MISCAVVSLPGTTSLLEVLNSAFRQVNGQDLSLEGHGYCSARKRIPSRFTDRLLPTIGTTSPLVSTRTTPKAPLETTAKTRRRFGRKPTGSVNATELIAPLCRAPLRTTNPNGSSKARASRVEMWVQAPFNPGAPASPDVNGFPV